jgi:hypothetical protein
MVVARALLAFCFLVPALVLLHLANAICPENRAKADEDAADRIRQWADVPPYWQGRKH